MADDSFDPPRDFGEPGNAPAPATVSAQVRPPAIVLAVLASVGILIAIWGLANSILQAGAPVPPPPAEVQKDPEAAKMYEAVVKGAQTAGIPLYAVQLVLSIVVVYGATRMMAVRGYGVSLTASILSMLPCAGPCCGLTLPIGIWTLVVLSRSDVKAAFARR